MFGPWLKARRNKLDLTRVALAKCIGCATITLQKIEQDQRRPSQQIAELLAQALAIPTEAHAEFIRFARGSGQPPLLDPQEWHPPPSTLLTNLPTPLTSFINRVAELAWVRTRLLQSDVRLLTMVGPPGIGKTRLSIQVGHALLDQFADGVWFIALAPISDPSLVLPAIARIFNISEAGPVPLLERLQTILRSREMLLILDNFEHVLDATPWVADLLKACAKVKLLVTSRVLLQVYGEHEFGVPTLSLPPKATPVSLQQLAEFDAVKLFVARVQTFQADFTLDFDSAAMVLDICERVDALPLAVELAAARLRRFTLQQLRNALHNAPLQTLTSATRDVEPRQRTLRAAIQWSYDLLNPTERLVFARLGVFVGSFSSEAAQAVCALPNDVNLHDLADQSLLKREDESRWSMLEMIREFALEQLPSEELEQARQKHAEYFARILKPGPDESYPLIAVELYNARAALRWLLDHRHPLTVELALALSAYFHQAGLTHEIRHTLPEVLSANIEMAPFVRNDLLESAAINAWQQHRFEEGLRYAQEGVVLARAINAQPKLADHLITLSRIYIEMDDCVQAIQIASEALQISRAIQNQELTVGALIRLGQAQLILGNIDEAEAFFEEAYVWCHALNFRRQVYFGLACLGMGALALSRRGYEQALEFLREGLNRNKFVAVKLWLLDVLAGTLGTMPHRTTSDVCQAAKIWGAAEALSERMGLINAPGDCRRADALIAKACSRIHPKTFNAAWAEGRRLSLDEAIVLAMSE